MAKVAMVLPNLRGGGAERVSLDLAYALRGSGCEVEFVLADAVGELIFEAREEFRIIDLKAKRMRLVFLSLGKYLKSERPDAVIAHMWPITAVAALASRVSGLSDRTICVEHGMLSKQYAYAGLRTNCLLRASLFISSRLTRATAAVSSGAAGDLARLSCRHLDNVKVIWNPVPAKRQFPDRAVQDAGAAWPVNITKRILNVGNVKPVKNHQLLLRAFARMNDREAGLLILGRIDSGSDLTVLAEELGIADRVRFAGFVSEPAPYYAAADLFALSSDSEGLPTVLVEALSSGLPIVSTDCPSGPAEILESGKWGRLVPVGDAEALARGMEEALAAPVDREALKRRAADFSPEIAARKYLEALGLSSSGAGEAGDH